MHSLPWYVVLLESIPEELLIVIVGLQLFGMKIQWIKAIAVSICSALLLYYLRQMQLVFGVHTLISMVFMGLAASLTMRIKIAHGFLAVAAGTIYVGILQILLLPIMLQINGLTLNDLVGKPWLNVVFFLPIGTVMLVTFLVLRHKKIKIMNLSGDRTCIEAEKNK